MNKSIRGLSDYEIAGSPFQPPGTMSCCRKPKGLLILAVPDCEPNTHAQTPSSDTTFARRPSCRAWHVIYPQHGSLAPCPCGKVHRANCNGNKKVVRARIFCVVTCRSRAQSTIKLRLVWYQPWRVERHIKSMFLLVAFMSLSRIVFARSHVSILGSDGPDVARTRSFVRQNA